MSIATDLTGQRFSRLLVQHRISSSPTGQARWQCLCDCGAIVMALGYALRQGKYKSCGCLKGDLCRIRQSTHGKSHCPEYIVWKNMKKRCDNPKATGYQHWGGRGIRVEWVSFEDFYKDMGARPTPTHTIERIDNNGHYSKTNCRWATRKEQAANKRLRKDSVLIEFGGRLMTIMEAAKASGIHPLTLKWRLAHWPKNRWFASANRPTVS